MESVSIIKYLTLTKKNHLFLRLFENENYSEYNFNIQISYIFIIFFKLQLNFIILQFFILILYWKKSIATYNNILESILLCLIFESNYCHIYNNITITERSVLLE